MLFCLHCWLSKLETIGLKVWGWGYRGVGKVLCDLILDMSDHARQVSACCILKQNTYELFSY